MEEGVKVILLGSARSGTHFLADIIQQHLGVPESKIRRSGLEPINEKFFDLTPDYDGKALDMVRERYHESEDLVFSILSYQLMESDLNVPLLIHEFPKAKFVLVNRVNKFYHYVSIKLAEKEKNYITKEYESKIGVGLEPLYEHARGEMEYFMHVMMRFEVSPIMAHRMNFYDKRVNGVDMSFFTEHSLYALGQFINKEPISPNLINTVGTKKQASRNIEEYMYNPEILKWASQPKFEI